MLISEIRSFGARVASVVTLSPDYVVTLVPHAIFKGVKRAISINIKYQQQQ